MDKIEFNISFPKDDSWSHSIDIFINDRKLINIIRDVEMPFAQKEGHPNVAGSYIGLSPEGLFLPSKYFYGEDKLKNGRIALFRCKSCGDIDCWTLLTKVSIMPEIIVWHEFEQPARTQYMLDRAREIFKDDPDFEERMKKRRNAIWDYGDLKFEFSRTQYTQALLDFQNYLHDNYRSMVTVFKDENYGWSLLIQRGHEYFDPDNTCTLLFDGKSFTCKVSEETKSFWDYSKKNFDKDEWESHSWEEEYRIFYLPNHPNLIYEWLSQHFDVELYLKKKKQEIEAKLSVPEEFWTGKNHCYPLGIHVVLSVQEAAQSFAVTPSVSQFEKYKNFLEPG